MIASLRGTVLDRTDETVTLQVGPIALEVFVPASLQPQIRKDAELILATHLVMNESGVALYGFGSIADRDFFRQLLGVTGVGPKSALAILAIDPQKVRTAIHGKDLATLGTIPGLGTKRAQRLILELGNALAEAPEGGAKRGKKSPAHPLADALSPALTKLGYSKDEIATMLASLPAEIEAPEAALQHLLKHAR